MGTRRGCVSRLDHKGEGNSEKLYDRSGVEEPQTASKGGYNHSVALHEPS